MSITNGTHITPSPAANGVRTTSGQDELITEGLAHFVAETTTSSLTDETSKKLKCLLLDYLGVSASAARSAESSEPFVNGILSFSGNAKGTATVFTRGSSFPPQYAALLNGAFCHTYDFDDTHAGAALHPGCSLISAALAQAEAQQASGQELLLSLLVGYELSCRLGIGLGTGSYFRGFHNTGTVGLYGSIASICKLRKSPQRVVHNAFGIALSKTAGSMQFMEDGCWNKRLHPGFAAHDAFLCIALAEAGAFGARQPIEGKSGLMHNYSTDGNPSGILKGLGTVWKFLDTACKPFPACRVTHGQLEMVGRLSKSHPTGDLPERIDLTLNKTGFELVGLPTTNKIHPECIVDGQFSAYYQIAASWIHGNNLGWAIYDHLQDPRVLDFCTRVKIEVDESYQTLESKMIVTFKDGTTVEERLPAPLGEPSRPFDWDSGVQKKFLGLGVPIYGEAEAKQICNSVDAIENISITELMKLLA